MEATVEQVMEEIQKLGNDHKANYETLRTSHESLKKALDEQSEDILSKEKIEKLTTDISVRQESLDKETKEAKEKIDERMDQIEVAMKRIPPATNESQDKIYQEAKQFQISALAHTKGGATASRIKSMEVDVKSYQEYKDVFETYIRRKGDERQLTAEEAKSLSVGIDPDGGYTVTPAMATGITNRLFEGDPVRGLANTETISTDSLELLLSWGDAGAEWESETITSTDETTPTFNKKDIPVHPLATRPRATQKLLEDSGINIESWLSSKVADRFIRTEGAAFVNGDGIGKPRGFLTYAYGSNFGQVEQVTMGSATALTTDGIIDVKYSLKEFFLNRGTWLMNRLTVRDLMKLKNGDGDYIWKPGITNDAQSTLLGLGVRMSTTMPVVAANSLSIVLADWAEAYTIVDRLGITIQRDPFTVKPLVEFYTRKRVGGDVVNFDAIKIGQVAV